ncbi:hypothetical protein SAMN05660862_0743 [Sphingobacterium psychroaquaticum]|uniref:Uncharacterized protein n=1 Tax=Sphingobacterium psychroaquaticum TaxID=561061 RepID=A0A1X7IER3_9SPHI|nr:hypothetical protein SAMN05660862_0743 [Sphingobacterium psychroaquaticum]
MFIGANYISDYFCCRPLKHCFSD